MSDDINEKTEFGPGKSPLYFYNNGLFSDPFVGERLPNIESYFQKQSAEYLNNHWNCEFTEEHAMKFEVAFNQIINLWEENKKELPNLKEPQLEERWIKPIFQYLGWVYEVQTDISLRDKNNYPDYALFSTTEKRSSYHSANSTRKKYSHALSVADAKRWSIDLSGKGNAKSNPTRQIVGYMEDTGKKWGILTNGQYWRIYSLRPDTKHTTYYEIDLEIICRTKNQERFKYFYNFFRKEAFEINPDISYKEERCFLDYVYEEGRSYASRVDENLKKRAFSVVENICKGFAHDKDNLNNEELNEIYEHSLYYLFKVMFILNSESRNLLEVGKLDYYYNSGSLRKKCLDLKEQYDNEQPWSYQTTSTYSEINNLFKLISKGDERIGVHGFGEEVFASGRKSFYKNNKIADYYINQALIDLATDTDKDGHREFIDYKTLSVDHIGSLFEGLLEYKFKYADTELLVVNDKVVSFRDATASQKSKYKNSKIKKGQLYLANDDGDRKSTGAYYTPSSIVDLVCKETLSPLVSGKNTEEILKLKICDPTMGSAHFLLGAIKFLDEVINKYQVENSDDSGNIEASDIKWSILHNSIFGFDVNPLAVELAKFSMWIYTSQKGDFLESLDKHLVLQDTLIPYSENYQDGFIENDVRYDAIVGNPPWDKVKFEENDFFKRFSSKLFSKKMKKADKKKIYNELLLNKEIKREFEYEKTLVDFKIESIKTSFYKLQEDTGGEEIRYIDFNLYKLSIERFFSLTKKGGRVGMVTPVGLLGDLGCTGLRKLLLKDNSLEQVVGFDEQAKVFDISQAFCYFIADSSSTTKKIKYVDKLFVGDIPDIDELLYKSTPLTKEIIEKFASNTLIVPFLKNTTEVSILKKCFDFVSKCTRVDLSISRELDQTDDAKYLTSSKGLYPVVKGDEIDHFKFRGNVKQYLNDKGIERHKNRIQKSKMKLAVRAISGTTLPRRLFCAVLPVGMITVNSIRVSTLLMDDEEIFFYQALMNSRSLEFVFKLISKNNNVNKFAVSMLPTFKYNPKNKSMAQISKLSKKIWNAKKVNIEEIAEIDMIIMDIFGLNKTEKNYLLDEFILATPDFEKGSDYRAA